MREKVLRTDPNNSEIRYRKVMYFPDRDAYAPHAPCLRHCLYVCFIF